LLAVEFPVSCRCIAQVLFAEAKKKKEKKKEKKKKEKKKSGKKNGGHRVSTDDYGRHRKSNGSKQQDKLDPLQSLLGRY
jgi:hypothetical protein